LAWRTVPGTPLLLVCVPTPAGTHWSPLPQAPLSATVFTVTVSPPSLCPTPFSVRLFAKYLLSPGGLTAKALRPSTGRSRAVQSRIFSASSKKLLLSSTLCQVFFEKFLFVFLRLDSHPEPCPDARFSKIYSEDFYSKLSFRFSLIIYLSFAFLSIFFTIL
jgi:hypothetical protein